jgi:molybdate transport system substrate-binding protein
MVRIGRSLIFGLIALVAWPGVLLSADVKVLSAGATRGIVTDLTAAFQAETGYTVMVTFGTAATLREKLEAGESWDVVVLPNDVLDGMIEKGLVMAGSRTDLGRSGMGVGVREGAPRPEISTPEAFRQALLKADSLTYVEGTTSGRHFVQVLERLGIAQAVRSKTRLLPGGRPAELVGMGEVEMVVHQISEIVPVKGVTLVGPLPRALQKVTTYTASVPARSAAPELGRALIRFLTLPTFKARLAAAGLHYQE